MATTAGAPSDIVHTHGYQWALYDVDTPDGPVDVCSTIGYGGQFISVARDRGLVVISNAHDFFGDGSGFRILTDVVSLAGAPR